MGLCTHDHAPAMSPAEAFEALAGSAVLVDVREPDEWAAGHAPEAVHVPLASVAASASGLPTDVPVIVICRSGRRSDAAAIELRRSGVDAINLTGGMQAWQQAGGSVVRDDGQPGSVI